MKKFVFTLGLGLLSSVAWSAGNHMSPHGTAEHSMPHHGMSGTVSGGATHAPIGQPGDPAKVSRTVEVEMLDTMRFTPSSIQVKKGETIRFIVKNVGQLPHEMVIGSLDDLKAHAIEMLQHAVKHDEPNAITLEAGEQGELIWHFDTSGVVDFACTIPGHMEGGMIGQFSVE